MRNTYTSKATSQRSTHINCRIFGIFSSSINKILLDAQIKEYNTKLSAKNNNTNALPTALHLPNLHHNHPLSLVSQNFRNLAITNPLNLRPSHIQSPIQHIVTQQPPNNDTYEQIIEQPHTTTFQSQNNHFFKPTMSRQVGSLHRSNSHPANLQNILPIIPLFAFPPPDSPQANT